MESIYLENAIFTMRQKRRFELGLTMKCILPRAVTFKYWNIFSLQAMSEKMERMELDLESKDKVPSIINCSRLYIFIVAIKSMNSVISN